MDEPTAPPPPIQRRADPATERRGMWARLAVLTVTAAIGLAIAYVIGLPPFPTCAFKIASGHPCPGCGMTRSVVNLAHADVLTSLRFHPLGVVMAGGLVAGILGALIGLVRGTDPVWELVERRGSWLFGSFLVALLGIWVVRAFLVPSWAPDPITPGGNWGPVLDLFR